jgi:DNA-binding NtrC family response regulator
MSIHTETNDRRQAGPEPGVATLHELEAGHIAHVLALVGGNQRRAARALGITRWSLARRLEKYGLRVREPQCGSWPRSHDE